jgi:hypothetical protein
MLKIILIVVISIIAVVVLAAVYLLVFVKDIKLKKDSTLTDEQLKAILCGANSVETGEYYNALETGDSAGTAKFLLKKHWEIVTKEDLLYCVENLSSKTSETDEVNIIYRARTACGDDRGRIFDYFDGIKTVDPEHLRLMYDVILYIEKRLVNDGVIRRSEKMKSSQAWDLSRAIWLMRCGYTANLTDENAAWTTINRCYARLKATYRDWEELSIDHIAGMLLLWSESGEKRYDVDIDRHKTLLTHKDSPWLKYSLN